MKKALTVAAVILSLACLAFSKGSEVALRLFGGAAMARYSELPDSMATDWFADDMKYRFGPAAGVGVDLVLVSSKRLAWVGSLEYVQKGAKVDTFYWDPFSSQIFMTIPVAYEMNVLSHTQFLKYQLFTNSTPYVLGGFELSYVIDHHASLWTEVAALTKKVDVGLVAGLGGELLTGSWTPFLEARYHLGLVNLSKGAYPGIGGFRGLRTRAFTFLAGIRLKWGRRPA